MTDFEVKHVLRFILDEYPTYELNERFLPNQVTRSGFCNVGTSFESIWELANDGEANETYVSDNLIDRISSSNAGDTQTVQIDGYTISSNEFTRVRQTATLNGQTAVTLTTPLARIVSLVNTGSTDFAGNVYAWQNSAGSTNGIPGDLSLTHIKVLGTDGVNESHKMAECTANNEFAVITGGLFSANLTGDSATVADFRVLHRELGSVFHRDPCNVMVGNYQSVIPVSFDPQIVIPPNSDYRIDVATSAGTADVTAALYGYHVGVK